MSFFIIPSGESYCNDRSKEFSENKNIYERRFLYYGKLITEFACDSLFVSEKSHRRKPIGWEWNLPEDSRKKIMLLWYVRT